MVKDFISKALINILVIVLVGYCLLNIFSVAMFGREFKLYVLLVVFGGTVYSIYAIYYIFKDPLYKGYIILISGLVLFEIYGSIVNLVFPHIILTPYYLLWIIYYYRLNRYHLKTNTGELLLILFLLSTFISAFMSNNTYVSIGYTAFTMLTILFISLCTSKMIRINRDNGISFVPIITASIVNMMFFSLCFLLYEIYGTRRGLDLSTYIQTNIDRKFDLGKYLSAGFMEPVGFAMMAAVTLTYYLVLFGFKKRSEDGTQKISFGSLKYTIIKEKYFIVLIIYSAFLLFISNSRTGYFGLFVTITTLVFLYKVFYSKRYKIKKYVSIIVITVFVIGASVTIARSIIFFNPENELLSSADRQRDTSLDYLIYANASIMNLGSSFWGTGAMTSSDATNYSDTTSVVNIISSLLNVGSTFGWITMVLNIVFYWYLFVKTKQTVKSGAYQSGEQLVILGS